MQLRPPHRHKLILEPCLLCIHETHPFFHPSAPQLCLMRSGLGLFSITSSLLIYTTPPHPTRHLPSTPHSFKTLGMEVWPWICRIPHPDTHSPLLFHLQNPEPGRHPSIHLAADINRDPAAAGGAWVTFSVRFQGPSSGEPRILWDSDAFPLSSPPPEEKPFLVPFLSQLVAEVISRSPAAHRGAIPSSRLKLIVAGPLAMLTRSHPQEALSGLFDIVFLARLFWVCACDAPAEVGSLYFKSLLAPNLPPLLRRHARVLRSFLIHIGAEAELRFMRSLGYMFSKLLILEEIGAGFLSSAAPSSKHDHRLGFCYAADAHGLWVLKGYAPLLSAERTLFDGEENAPRLAFDAQRSLLRYALAHQQLEAVIQLEYSVRVLDRYIEVKARVDNLRFHVARLGFGDDIDQEHDRDHYAGGKHYPSRIRVWVGPEMGSAYVSGLSLAQPTNEVEMERGLKGSCGKLKGPGVRANRWRWCQSAEGNVAVFDAVLCDVASGLDAATWMTSGGGDKAGNSPRGGCAAGKIRSSAKSGGAVIAGGQCGQEVTWRLGKEVGGRVLRWRLGAQVWVTYWPHHGKSSFRETRRVEWCDEVDLTLNVGN